jgi:hypothetical protein
MAKNYNLCEEPYCRERFRWFVSGYWHSRSWVKRVCDEHVKPYRTGQDSVGRSIHVSLRSEDVE